MSVNNLGLKSPWYDLLGFLGDCLQISKYMTHILQERKPLKRLGQKEETVQERDRGRRDCQAVLGIKPASSSQTGKRHTNPRDREKCSGDISIVKN